MAFAPCTQCGKGFKGGASTFFPALLHSGERQSRRLKLCPDCAASRHEYAEKHLSLVSVGDQFFEQQRLLACSNCGGDLGEASYAFFLNEYLRGEQERQFYGQICGPCSAPIAEEWSITS